MELKCDLKDQKYPSKHSKLLNNKAAICVRRYLLIKCQPGDGPLCVRSSLHLAHVQHLTECHGRMCPIYRQGKQ